MTLDDPKAEEALGRHFADVSAEPVEGWVTFETTAARNYIAASIVHTHLAERVPELTSPLRVRRKNAIFVAEKAA